MVAFTCMALCYCAACYGFLHVTAGLRGFALTPPAETFSIGDSQERALCLSALLILQGFGNFEVLVARLCTCPKRPHRVQRPQNQCGKQEVTWNSQNCGYTRWTTVVPTFMPLVCYTAFKCKWVARVRTANRVTICWVALIRGINIKVPYYGNLVDRLVSGLWQLSFIYLTTTQIK